MGKGEGNAEGEAEVKAAGVVAEAAKLARYANSALDFADVDEAVGYLKEAISQLTRPPPGGRRAK